jgi:hypothetical protein
VPRQRAEQIDAAVGCRFGAAGAPFAVACLDLTERLPDEDCLAFDPANLSLRRPDTSEGTGSDAWALVDGGQRMLCIDGSWQQSYDRGSYLISFLQATGTNRICFVNRPKPDLGSGISVPERIEHRARHGRQSQRASAEPARLARARP